MHKEKFEGLAAAHGNAATVAVQRGEVDWARDFL